MGILIIDPIGGISGDMLLGSLVHLGCPVDYLNGVFAMLPVSGYSLETARRSVNGISSLDIAFICGRSHEERTHALIRDEILAPLPEPVRGRAREVFRVLAEAEASVHGESVDDVHFHEVGALDSILDIVGISAAIEYFGVTAIYSRPVPLGTGTTKSRHGVIPLPAPATVKLLEGWPVRFTDITSELATPTGAAVIAALARKGDPPADLIVSAVGYGCGDRQIPDWPNLCRSILCREAPRREGERTFVVEADVDDMNPEETEGALSRLFDAGARDASLIPKIMKRGRPGVTFHAICTEACLDGVVNTLLIHTPSIGVRYFPVERRVLERTSYRISTEFGDITVKESTLPDGTKRIKSEYSDVARIAAQRGVSIGTVRRAAEKATEDRTG
ncbi:MAG TPA: nickel pincer cofactor biosynthesis protein LarC [Deltaproteobacteria bacterium]|nr:nickel pincer cofactor biosynthesis protein LarC [Deltaproteobacteria bacterium]